MKTKHRIAIFGIASILILNLYALSQGIDGISMGLAFGGIGAIVGYFFKSVTGKPGPRGERGEQGERGEKGSDSL